MNQFSSTPELSVVPWECVLKPNEKYDQDTHTDCSEPESFKQQLFSNFVSIELTLMSFSKFTRFTEYHSELTNVVQNERVVRYL